MEKLRTYLNSLGKVHRAQFVAACGTSEGYLRKAISTGQKLGGDLCISIDRESGGVVTCEDLRPDADWAYLRFPVTSPEKTPA
jgi:DNA-binding transcriptional regulator YdaS (Cro superfamily)